MATHDRLHTQATCLSHINLSNPVVISSESRCWSACCLDLDAPNQDEEPCWGALLLQVVAAEPAKITHTCSTQLREGAETGAAPGCSSGMALLPSPVVELEAAIGGEQRQPLLGLMQRGGLHLPLLLLALQASKTIKMRSVSRWPGTSAGSRWPRLLCPPLHATPRHYFPPTRSTSLASAPCSAHRGA